MQIKFLSAGSVALAATLLMATFAEAQMWKGLLPGSGKQDAKQGQQLSLARLTERHGQTTNAEQLYRAVLKSDPQNQTAHHRLAIMAAKARNAAEADEHFRQAMAGPPSAELQADYGYALYLQNRLPEAERQLQATIAKFPDHKATYNTLALVLGEQGRHEEALAAFRKVNGEAEARANMGYMLAQNGQIEQANAEYHRALSLDNSLRPAAEALVQLSEMQSAQANAARRNNPTANGPKAAGKPAANAGIASSQSGMPSAPNAADVVTIDRAAKADTAANLIAEVDSAKSFVPGRTLEAKQIDVLAPRLPDAVRFDTKIQPAVAEEEIKGEASTQTEIVTGPSRSKRGLKPRGATKPAVDLVESAPRGIPTERPRRSPTIMEFAVEEAPAPQPAKAPAEIAPREPAVALESTPDFADLLHSADYNRPAAEAQAGPALNGPARPATNSFPVENAYSSSPMPTREAPRAMPAERWSSNNEAIDERGAAAHASVESTSTMQISQAVCLLLVLVFGVVGIRAVWVLHRDSQMSETVTTTIMAMPEPLTPPHWPAHPQQRV